MEQFEYTLTNKIDIILLGIKRVEDLLEENKNQSSHIIWRKIKGCGRDVTDMIETAWVGERTNARKHLANAKEESRLMQRVFIQTERRYDHLNRLKQHLNLAKGNE